MRPAPLIVGLLAVGLCTPPLSPAAAAAGVPGTARWPTSAGPRVEQIVGSTAVDIAVEVAREYDAGVAVAYVAAEGSPADGAVAAARAGARGGPLLLTHADVLPPATLGALRRLDPGRVVVVGGESAVSEGVLESLRALLPGRPVQRVAGQDRYSTAAELATYYPQGHGVAYVVAAHDESGASLAAAALAARDRAPLLLVGDRGVPAATAVALTRLQPGRIVVVGGEQTVPESVVIGLEALVGVGLVGRLAGPDRYTTAARVALEFTAPGYAYLAPGGSTAEGVAAAARAGHDLAPVLLTRDEVLPQASASALSRLAPSIVYVVSDEGAGRGGRPGATAP